ncbi:toxin-antitoxin system HicB family antitoxin [Variovorax sp. WS11]|uniref:toxin-antitoxin system HicB family antitoxin n=1 Tax=Variovorax sp. WS11 TaxID=1105204 RepID=UPI0015E65336|nr:toxin-antitoxin system HicB family antitoxin [Variovorax sp. WS11]
MAKQFNPQDYQVIIRKTVEDGEALFEARVAELPDVTVYGSTQAKAYRDALAIIGALHDSARESRTAFPAPASALAQAEFSGRVTVRLARSDHARAAHCAEREGVSLNSLIAVALARHVATSEAEASAQAREDEDAILLRGMTVYTASDVLTPVRNYTITGARGRH